MTQPIKVSLVDDHKLFRMGMSAILNAAEGIEVLAEAENGGVFMGQLAEGKIPDVVLLDLEMPDMDGMEVVEALKRKGSETKVILLTMHNDDRFILHFMESGAGAYLLKDAHPVEVENAIREVATKGFYINDHVAQTMVKGLKQKREAPTKPGEQYELTEREMEVLQLICQELTTPQIADKLFLSPRTVEGYRKTLLKKTGTKNVAGLAILAVKQGWF